MTKKNSTRNTLHALTQIHHINTNYKINGREAKILDLIVCAHVDGGDTYIGDVIKWRDIATDQTIRKDLLSLHEKKLLAIDIDQVDARKRFIQPSEMAYKRLKELDLVLTQAQI